MHCGGGVKALYEFNNELVYRGMARLLMRFSFFHMDCACHLVVLFCSSLLFMPYQSLFDLVPLRTWGLREGAQKHLSLKCVVNVKRTHMRQPQEQYFHLLLQNSLCQTTQVST